MATLPAPLAPPHPLEDRDGRTPVPGRHRARPATPPARKQRVVLDEGLSCFVGHGPLPGLALREPAILLAFHGDGDAMVSVAGVGDEADTAAAAFVVVATMATCERAFGFVPALGQWHLSANLRAIIGAIAAYARTDTARTLYLRGKGLELVCETVEQLKASALTPCGGSDDLSEADTRRIIAARALIERSWHEPLTLDGIARACGLNRSKLSRGFRDLFGTTVATLLRDARMHCARELLLTTDLRVATIGFRSGYENNVSFARAFLRQYGVSPMAMRAMARG